MTRRNSRESPLTVPERCAACPVLLEALGSIAAEKNICTFDPTAADAIRGAKETIRDAGYDIIVDNDELLDLLRARTISCIGAITLEQTVEKAHYTVTVCGSIEATIPLHHQSMIFEPSTVERKVIDE